VDPEGLRQLQDTCTGQIPGNQLPDLFKREVALDLFVTARWRSMPLGRMSGRAIEDEVFDSFPEASIEQIRTKTRPFFVRHPWWRGV